MILNGELLFFFSKVGIVATGSFKHLWAWNSSPTLFLFPS